MIIDTKKRVIGSRFRGFIISIIFMVAIVMVIQLVEKELFGLEKKYYIYMLVGLYIVYFIWMLFLDRHYIFYSDKDNNIIFKYFSLRPLVSTKKSVLIPKNTFVSFKSKQSFFTLKEKIIIQQQVKGKIANYPPISISILNKKERKMMKDSLSSLSKK